MSRRRGRRRPCPLCRGRGVNTPAVTHRVVWRFPGELDGEPIWGSPRTIRYQVCPEHAATARGFVAAVVYRLKGRRR